MSKIIPKKIREKIVKLRDEEVLSWATIGQQTDLHRETVRKQYLLEKAKGVSPLTIEKSPVSSEQAGLESSVKQEFELLAKRQEVLEVIDNHIAVIEGEEWTYVEDKVLLLRKRLDFLESKAEKAKDINTLNEVQRLVFEEIQSLRKLGREQVEAENKARERERQKRLIYIKEHYLERNASKDEVNTLIGSLAKYGSIEAEFQLVKGEEAMENLRGQCFDSGIDSQFVEDVLSFSIPKLPTMAYVRQLWWDAQKIHRHFGTQEFVWFWSCWGRFTIQGRQSLWLTFLAWKRRAQPAWGSYQSLW